MDPSSFVHVAILRSCESSRGRMRVYYVFGKWKMSCGDVHALVVVLTFDQGKNIHL